jgi:hypothetical protein
MTRAAIDPRRLVSALVVVLLHGLLVLALLHATVHRATRASPAQELIMQFFRPPAPAKPETAPPPPVMAAPSTPRANGLVVPPPAAAPNGSALQGLHQFLFDCAPENLGNLTPEERTQCEGQALAPNPDETNSLRNFPSQSRGAAHWARGLARKQNPLLLPCMHAQGLPLSPDVIYCLGKAAVTGNFGDLDEASGYGDPLPADMMDSPHPGDPVLEPAHH